MQESVNRGFLGACVLAILALVLMGGGCTQPLAEPPTRIKPPSSFLTWSASPNLPKEAEGLSGCTLSWQNVVCDFGGLIVTTVQPGDGPTAVVDFEYRTEEHFTMDGRSGLYWASSLLDEESYSRLKDEVLALCKARAKYEDCIAAPVLFIDRPNRERIAVPRDISETPHETFGGYGTCATNTVSSIVGRFMDAVDRREPVQGERTPLRLRPFAVRHLSFEELRDRGTPDGIRMSKAMLEGRLLPDAMPGAFLDIYLRSSRRPLPQEALRELWPKSSKSFRLGMLNNMARYGLLEQRASAARLLGDLIVEERGSEMSDQRMLNDLAWTLLFAIKMGAACRQEWAYDAAVDLLRRDIDKDDETRVLFQWLPASLLNYRDGHERTVVSLLKDRLHKSMVYNVTLGARPLAELAPPGAVDLLREVRQRLASGPCKWAPTKIDYALVVLGDRAALAHLVRLMNSPDEEFPDQRLTATFKALGFICYEEELEAGLPNAPLGNRSALADWVVARAEAGRPVMPTPFSRLSSPRYAAWLLSESGRSQLPGPRLLEQLAWQTTPEAVDRMIELLKAGDKDALSAVSNRWTYRLFPRIVSGSHAEYSLTPEALADVDWESVRQAARDGTLHYYSVSNLDGAHHMTILGMYKRYAGTGESGAPSD